MAGLLSACLETDANVTFHPIFSFRVRSVKCRSGPSVTFHEKDQAGMDIDIIDLTFQDVSHFAHTNVICKSGDVILGDSLKS